MVRCYRRPLHYSPQNHIALQLSHKNSCEISVNEQNILSSWGKTQTTMYLNNGALLKNGEYRIEKVLAAGGFGITYLAMQVALGRKVAVKEFFMKEHCNRDSGNSYVSVPSVGSKEQVEHFKEKFLKEARLIASFDHSNIIRIHDVFEENGTAYYVMEYLEGESLSTLVARCGAIDEQVALRYTRQVADALAEVHAGNLLHLDVKPANIMLNKKGEAVLIDFGISKHYDETGSQTSSAAVGISEGYAPLEQYEAGALGSFTPATDIYSLGATLYFLVTGQRPPKAGDVMNDGLPVLPSDISPEVRAAIEAAMQPRRKDRPQSVAEFLNLLESTDNREQSTDNREQGEDLIDDSDVEVTVAPVYRAQRTDNRVQRVNAKAIEVDNEETRALEKEPEQVAVTDNEPAESKKNHTALVAAVVLLGVLVGGGYFFAFSGSDSNYNNSNSDNNDRFATHNEEPATTVVIEDTEEEKPTVPTPPVVIEAVNDVKQGTIEATIEQEESADYESVEDSELRVGCIQDKPQEAFSNRVEMNGIANQSSPVCFSHYCSTLSSFSSINGKISEVEGLCLNLVISVMSGYGVMGSVSPYPPKIVFETLEGVEVDGSLVIPNGVTEYDEAFEMDVIKLYGPDIYILQQKFRITEENYRIKGYIKCQYFYDSGTRLSRYEFDITK